MRIDRGSLLYGASILTVSNIISQLLGFIYRVALSRLITTEELGLYQMIMPVYSVVTAFCVSGFTVAVSRLSSEYLALGKTDAVRALVRRCVRFFLVITIVFAMAVVLFSHGISTSILGDSRTRTALVCLMPVLLLTGIENIYKNHFYGVGRIIPPAITEIIEMLARMSAVIGMLLVFRDRDAGHTVALIVIGMIFCEIFSSVTLFVIYRRSRGRLTGHFPEGLSRKIFSVAVPIALTNVLGNLLSSANSILIPARLVAAGWERADALSALGVLFGMTMPMLTLPMVLIVGLGLVMVPKLSESMARGDMRAVRRKIAKAMLVVCTLSMPIAAVFVPLGEELGRLIFGRSAAGQYIAPLSICVTLSAIQGISGTALNGIDKQRFSAVNFILGDAVQLFCTYFFTAIPGVGLRGFIAGQLLGTALTMTLNLICVRRQTGLEIRWRSWLITPLVSSAAAYFAVKYLFAFFSARGPALPAVLFSMIFGVLIYSGLLYLQGIRISALIRLRAKD